MRIRAALASMALIAPGVGPSPPSKYTRPGHAAEQLLTDITRWIHDPKAVK